MREKQGGKTKERKKAEKGKDVKCHIPRKLNKFSSSQLLRTLPVKKHFDFLRRQMMTAPSSATNSLTAAAMTQNLSDDAERFSVLSPIRYMCVCAMFSHEFRCTYTRMFSDVYSI